jgi:selenocysteine lyase/cysteine desulfurase
MEYGMPPSAAPDALHAHEFPITREYTYLNTATQGPIPNGTRTAIEQAATRAQFPETPHARVEQHPADLARTRLAGLLHAHPDDLAFTMNTTHGLNICAHGIDWQPGDHVVLAEHEFPSVTRTWLHLRSFGVEVRCVHWQGNGPQVDDLMAAVDSHTRVVACSAVAWDTGYLMDLEELGRRCAQAGCLLIVDGIQAVGAIDLDPAALRISALGLHGYKWLLSGFGCGALYVAPNAIEQIRPRFVGEQSYMAGAGAEGEPATWQPGARRYLTGTVNLPGLAALAASLELIERIGMPAITRHNREITQFLTDELQRRTPHVELVSPHDPARRAAIVVFTLGNRSRDEALVQQLEAQGIIVALRPRGIRVSPHFFNSAAEIERLLHIVAQHSPLG